MNIYFAKGFSLIELVIVIGLMSFVVPSSIGIMVVTYKSIAYARQNAEIMETELFQSHTIKENIYHDSIVPKNCTDDTLPTGDQKISCTAMISGKVFHFSAFKKP